MKVLNLESFPFPKEWLEELRVLHARVLRVLMPSDDGEVVPVLTREELAQRAGWNRTAGRINKALGGIPAGSRRGKPHKGLLNLGLVEEVKRYGIKAYRITPDGCKAIGKIVGELPKLKDKSSCTNHRYQVTTLTEEEIVEGRRVLKLHKARERKPQIVKRKKNLVLKTTGLLLCEACGFDFAAVYGNLGDGFAECHHRLPLAEYDAAAPTRLEDLAILCANCHRILHRSRLMIKVEELRSVILQRRAERCPAEPVAAPEGEKGRGSGVDLR